MSDGIKQKENRKQEGEKKKKRQIVAAKSKT